MRIPELPSIRLETCSLPRLVGETLSLYSAIDMTEYVSMCFVLQVFMSLFSPIALFNAHSPPLGFVECKIGKEWMDDSLQSSMDECIWVSSPGLIFANCPQSHDFQIIIAGSVGGG
jgi:hypothetical protein